MRGTDQVRLLLRSFLLLSLLFTSSCMAIAYQEPRTAALATTSIEASNCRFLPDFVGWSYFPQDKERIEALIQPFDVRSAASIQPGNDEPRLLEISLEQTDITPAWRKLPNVIVTVLSSGIFPLVEYFEYYLTFRIRNQGEVTLVHRYRIMSHTVVTALVIPLTPFLYPPDQRQEALEEATEDFIAVALRPCAGKP
ncbi:MAG: hypothetical protein KDK23_05405 [Leptospiraceae bacterium]|nr:hypothetical protein [Leptospiraceae bacterium]